MIKTGLTLKGIKQTALAEALNVSENTVTHWVQSRRLPDRESLYELKEYFNWSDAKLEMIVEDWHANGHGEKNIEWPAMSMLRSDTTAIISNF